MHGATIKIIKENYEQEFFMERLQEKITA